MLHVTSAHCDDDVITSLCAGVLSALALHGCSTVEAALPEDTRAGLAAVDAAGIDQLNGDGPGNIGQQHAAGDGGGHLELTGPLREAMFGVNTRPRRKDTTEVFWNLAVACRNAPARLEAGQVSHPIAGTKHHGHPQ